MSKPKYVYHGSQYLFDTVKPQKACGENAKESQYAIYAAETMDEVIPFALPIRWYPDNPSGKREFSVKNGNVFIKYGSLNPDGIGYIYKLKSDSFEKLDEWQWVSQVDVTPDDIICIKVRDYIHRVFFTDTAKENTK